jgi:hypothetical protein
MSEGLRFGLQSRRSTTQSASCHNPAEEEDSYPATLSDDQDSKRDISRLERTILSVKPWGCEISPQSDRHQANASTGNSVSFDRTGAGDEMAFFSTLRYTFSPMTSGGFLRRPKSVPFVYKSRIRVDGTSTSLAVQAVELRHFWGSL